MAILEIKKFNENVLRTKSKEVREINVKIKELVLNMVETMKKNQGIGLAGPQVGVSKRIITVQVSPRSSKIVGLINPKILKKSSETGIEEEGCLSFPGIFLKIKRAKEVEVEALNINGNKVRIKAKGVFARVIQHEIDHLNGFLFFNRLNFFQRIKFKLQHFSIKL